MVEVLATTQALTLTELSATISNDINVAADVVSMTLTENAALISYDIEVLANRAQLWLTTFDVAITFEQISLLPQAFAGAHVILCVEDLAHYTTWAADIIYDGPDVTGTNITGNDPRAILELYSPDSGVWFVFNKTGSWTIN